MRFLSTRGSAPRASFREALFAGMAPDGGLYVPEALDPIPIDELRGASLVDLGTEIAAAFVGDDVPRPQLARLLASALDFPVPVIRLNDGTGALELFHGPTFAFKDVGARVMARLMAHLAGAQSPLTVLVATSGDTGSAVAQAFFGLEGTRVVVLFPEGGVTPVQEAQFTTLGENVTAVAVAGAFDDCQRLVKESFADRQLRDRMHLTSANSINIGRLLPQVFYYAYAALQDRDRPAVFSVPSGNFGNLTAGLWAWKLGAPIAGFVAATTINDTMPRYVATGRYEPRPSVATLANAMDVGNPSNAERIRWLFDDKVDALRRIVTPSVHSDAEVRLAIRDIWNRHGYLAEPHSAIGYLGLASYDRPIEAARIFLATAHPGKFRDAIEPLIGESVLLPPALEAAMSRPRSFERIPAQLSALRALLEDR
jgi:threonine synthase